MYRLYILVPIFLIILLFLPYNVLTSTKKINVAVLEFDVKGDLGIQDAGSIIAEWMINSVHKTNEYNLKERVLLKKILVEQNLGMSGIVDKKTASKIGQIYGVKGIITGSVIKWGKTISVTARLIDTDNGSILKTAKVTTTNIEKIPDEIDDLALIIAGKQSERIPVTGADISEDRVKLPQQDIIINKDLGLMIQGGQSKELLSWKNAHMYCSQLSLGGYSDWRLPTKGELMALMTNKSRVSSRSITGKLYIDIKDFPSTLDLKRPNFWTSTQKGTSFAFFVSFSDKKTEYDDKTANYHVKAVRSSK